MISRNARAGLAIAAGATALLALTACVPNTSASGNGESTSVAVSSTADACAVSKSTAPSGTVVFTVKNNTDQVTEFYLLADDGLRVVGEVENVSPGVPRTLTVHLAAGKYFTVCKPGMAGEGVGKAEFTVTGSGKAIELTGTRSRLTAAAKNYVAYLRDQVSQLVPATQGFLAAYLAGDTATAMALYPTARAYYERIEPVAESFGDLDPELDNREADVASGDEWTGWHRIEKDLWPPANAGYLPLTPDQRIAYAAKLTTNTQQLSDAVHASDYSVSIDAISNGAIGLLDEVASGKITGEEEIWSHTDLWDFQANLEGAKVAYDVVRDIVAPKNPALVKTLDSRFGSLETQLAGYGSLATGFRFYDQLTTSEIKALADGVNALGEPLSRLTAAVVD
ncbi:MAG: iron uptake system component EfeO [Microbacteriaceae bacterium]|nr:iron uptake system component EfeO [Microbacteriaceae bacterium]